MNKLIIMVLLTIIVSLQYKLWLKPDGIKGMHDLKRVIKQQELELEALKLRNEELLNSVILIKKNTKSIEEHARVNLGMIKKEETYYRIVE